MPGARTERREIPPFQPIDGFISRIRYRYSTNSKFQDIEGSPKAIVVPVDDLRTIPRHELSVIVDTVALPKIYVKGLAKLNLIILTRDTMLRKEQVLYQAPIDNLPESFVLDPAKLKGTSCRTELPLELQICAIERSPGVSGWPNRRASRLATWYLNLLNHSKGPRFPWVRKTSEDFKAAGLPANSSYYVDLLTEPDELLSNVEDQIDDLLAVWVHEDVWIVLQQTEANLGVSGIQRLFATQVALQILEIVAPPLHKGKQYQEESVCGQLLEHIATQTKAEAAFLAGILSKRGTSLDLAPYVSAAFGVNKALKRVLD
jgi:hypothetical protein